MRELGGELWFLVGLVVDVIRRGVELDSGEQSEGFDLGRDVKISSARGSRRRCGIPWWWRRRLARDRECRWRPFLRMWGMRITVSGRDAMRLDKFLFSLRVIGHVAIDRFNGAESS